MFYTAFLTGLAPFGRAYLRMRPRYAPLLDRFNPAVPPFTQQPLWIHACSVGEVNTAAPIIHEAHKRWPEIPVALSVSTISGRRRAEEMFPGVPVLWFPFDQPWIVRRYVRALRPRALVLIETELWPAVLHETARAGVPVVLLNGRISAKHYDCYRRARTLFRPALATLARACMQTPEYARRIESLGANPAAIRVVDTVKFDAAPEPLPAEKIAALRADAGLGDAPVLVFGSTRPGDENLAATCWQALRTEFPLLRLVVAPRHPTRIEEAVAPFSEPVVRRSQQIAGRSVPGARVLFLDTIGELAAFYALASIAVIGGSFFPGVEGHNPLEPAAQGTPVVFGPYMGNFPAAAEALLGEGGAVQVDAPPELVDVLRDLLRDEVKRRAIGESARIAVDSRRGAVRRNLDVLAEVLDVRGV